MRLLSPWWLTFNAITTYSKRGEQYLSQYYSLFIYGSETAIPTFKCTGLAIWASIYSL